jgi:hypothetical protein
MLEPLGILAELALLVNVAPLVGNDADEFGKGGVEPLGWLGVADRVEGLAVGSDKSTAGN